MVRLDALCFDARDPALLARFWAGVLGWRVAAGAGHVTLVPDDDSGFVIRFTTTTTAKSGPNWIHFDLTSASSQQQQETVARALQLGARHLDIGQGPDADHVVLADPEENEFCVIPAGNGFLADCGFLGALSSDGSQQVGYFWSRALGWPLVWDQDEETAIRSAHGGPIISWGGPPLVARADRNRLRYDLAVPPDGDLPAEVEWLVSLGATRLDTREPDVGVAVMADPDGNEFRVVARGAVRPPG